MSSSRPRAPHGPRFAPRLEALEARDVPAGNVTVLVGDGILYVAGDDAANQFSISGTGKNSVIVRPLDDTTTINGRAGPLSVGGIKRGYYVRSYGGDDLVFITGTRSNGLLDVDTGDGNDDLRVDNAGHRKETVLGTGAGNDSVILNGAWFGRPVYVNTGFGDDQLIASGIRAEDFVTVNPGGTDTFENRGSAVSTAKMTGFTAGPRSAAPATDTAGPTAVVAAVASGPTRVAPLEFTITFNEAVAAFGADDVVITNGTLAGLDATSDRAAVLRVTPTGQGPVTVRVVAGAAADTFGNRSTESNTATATFDSLAPALAIAPLTTNDTTPVITGTVDDPAATVTATVNGQTVTATVTGTTWAAQVTTPLANGTYTVTAMATDPVGNSAAAALTNGLVIDTAAPAALLFGLAPGSDSGPVGDLRTENDAVVLTGTAEAGATVRLFRATSGTAPGSGAAVAETTATAGGTFSVTVPLAVGPNSLVARAVDAAGNLGPTLAQTFTRNTAPTVVAVIGAQTPAATDPDLTFDLTSTFDDVERVVRLATTYPGGSGNVDINLFAAQAPNSVANFLAYVNGAPAGNYNDSIFHRLASGFVLQGGGFKFNDAGTTATTAFPAIADLAPLANEPGVSNTRGTVAFAKGNTPNSATNEFFFNLRDSSANLDLQNGGFSVFGQVSGAGQAVVDAIAALPTYPGNGTFDANGNVITPTTDLPGAPPFPVAPGADTTNFPANIDAADLAFVTTAAELTEVQRLTFTATSSNQLVATASAAGGTLTVDPLAPGTTTITVRATDLDGSFTETTFTVTVS